MKMQDCIEARVCLASKIGEIVAVTNEFADKKDELDQDQIFQMLWRLMISLQQLEKWRLPK